MSIEKEYGAIFAMTLFIVLVVVIRFIAISEQLTFELNDYAKVMAAFLKTSSRAQILLVQFVGVLTIAGLAPAFLRKEINVFICALSLFTLVSILRFMLPVFVVSIIGDLVVILVLIGVFKGYRVPKITLLVFIVASLILVPKGLLLLGIGALLS